MRLLALGDAALDAFEEEACGARVLVGLSLPGKPYNVASAIVRNTAEIMTCS
jgi:hypothetical protein